MKLKPIVSAVAIATCAVGSSAVMAWGYDQVSASGGDPTQAHSFNYKLPSMGDPGCDTSGSCGQLPPGGTAAGDLECDYTLVIHNGLPATGTLGSPVFDTSVKEYRLNSTLTGSPVDSVAPFDTPPTASYFSCFFPVQGAALTEVNATSGAFAWDLVTRGDGKITDGYLLNEVPYNGIIYLTLLDFTMERQCSWHGTFPASSMDIQAIRDAGLGGCKTYANSIGATLISDSETAPGMWSYNTFGAGLISKAVPVPAFAAAVLGLGLIGVTFLTGRKRSIK